MRLIDLYNDRRHYYVLDNSEIKVNDLYLSKLKGDVERCVKLSKDEKGTWVENYQGNKELFQLGTRVKYCLRDDQLEGMGFRKISKYKK